MGDGEHRSAFRTGLRGTEAGAGPLAESVPERAPADPVTPPPSRPPEAVTGHQPTAPARAADGRRRFPLRS
ncbi:hypothetical protein GCM10009864_34100 [Streptomyces lunalinharesii]|uniref:Uncharacterized protein n=1 Tax=Streptomyces lunalinharesii TaxID=333384 RepID=A0ABP6EB21_9ACTN